MDINVKNFGAISDGASVNTEIIQKAIDECFNNGGGRVILPRGVYLTGSLTLKSNVELHIEAGATLLGSPKCEDYPEKEGLCHVISENLPRRRNASLIFAENAENIAVTGMGKIDCNGESFVEKKTGQWRAWQYQRIDAPTPPRVVFFTGCKNVKVEDITMVNQPAGWSYWIHDCDFVTFDKCKILAEVEYPNNDGIHINSSRNVNISNCNIVTGDDCIVVRANNRSLNENKVCERVTVTNCNLTSYACCIRIGWAKDGVIRNCTFSNIVMTDSNKGICLQLPKAGDPLAMPDQGREAPLIENISFNNIIMSKMYAAPVFIYVHDEAECDGVRGIYFSDVHADGLLLPYIKGKSENLVENVYFSNCTFKGVTNDEPEKYVRHGETTWCRAEPGMMFKYVKNVVMNNTSFDLQ